MGVLDVLPHALSSKYFFWDSDYAALAPGKFSALKEAEWVQRAARTCPALHYYYMGFYIHSCHKMRYKADYQPSDLLCPERLTWVPFQHVKAALDVSWLGLHLLVPHAETHALSVALHASILANLVGLTAEMRFCLVPQPPLQQSHSQQHLTGLMLCPCLSRNEWYVAQEKEYQVLSDLPNAAEGLGTHRDITAEPQNSDSAKLSNAKVGDEAMSASLVYWRDLDSPYQLMRFSDMEASGVPEVCVYLELVLSIHF